MDNQLGNRVTILSKVHYAANYKNGVYFVDYFSQMGVNENNWSFSDSYIFSYNNKDFMLWP